MKQHLLDVHHNSQWRKRKASKQLCYDFNFMALPLTGLQDVVRGEEEYDMYKDFVESWKNKNGRTLVTCINQHSFSHFVTQFPLEDGYHIQWLPKHLMVQTTSTGHSLSFVSLPSEPEPF